MSLPEEKFTLDDVQNCWAYWREYFVDILNGDYELEQARNDLKSLIGTEGDLRNTGKIIKSDNPQQN